jgi:hypothetical protein
LSLRPGRAAASPAVAGEGSKATVVISALGAGTIVTYGACYHAFGVLVSPIHTDTGWSRGHSRAGELGPAVGENTRAGKWRETSTASVTPGLKWASKIWADRGPKPRPSRAARSSGIEPDVILMDEPASALDPIATQRIEDLVAELKGECRIVIVPQHAAGCTGRRHDRLQRGRRGVRVAMGVI